MKKAKKLSLIILAMMFALSVALLSACAPTKYEIQLDDGLGNANSIQTTEINKDEEFTLPQMTQSKTGYVFDGWKRGSDGTVFNAGETVKITGHTSFAAQWKGNSYTIVFHFDQDSQITSEQKMTYGTAALLKQNTFVKTGFDFAGWQDEDGNTYTDKQQVNNLTAEKDGTFNLYAVWEVKKYDLTLVFDNGEENLTTKYAFGADISGITDPDKEGYTFAGWYESETFEGDEYLLGTMPANNMTLFAKWEINSYDITFVLNNGEANKVVSYDFGANTSEITKPEKVGFTFGGWYDNEACTGTPYIFGTMPAKNVTLYAKWTVNSYTITFVKNNGESNTSVPYNFGATTSALDSVNKEGYTFAGWYESQTFEGEPYVFGTMPAKNVVLYAKWTINSYDLTFVLNNGNEDVTVSYDYDEATSAIATPDKEGHTFVGWYESQTFEGAQYVFGNMPAKNVTLYAKWEINSYDIVFVKNNGEENQTVSYDYDEATSAIATPDKEGHTFVGWYESQTFEGAQYVFGNMPAKNVTLYAKWDVNSYTITFVKNNGEQNDIVSYDFGAAVSEPTPVNEGYTFGKWYESQSFAGDPYVFGTMPAKNITLYAKWAVNPYTLTLVKNNGEANVEVIYDFDEQMNVPSVPVKEGYTFAGWYESQTFEGEQYAFGKMPAKNFTLYAKWTINSYDLTFVKNNGEQNETVRYVYATDTSAIATPIREGYTFAGWYDNEACTGNPYVFGTMPAKNVTLYAKWTVNSYDIVFVKNNGEGNQTVSYDFGEATSAIATPDKEGYTFVGWYENQNFEGEQYAFGTMPAKNVTLYAKWNVNSYDITFVLNNGEQDEIVTYAFGTTTSAIATPEKEGYTFAGWYDNEACAGSPCVFGTMPAHGVTLYAKWTVNSYDITFVLNNGEENATVSYDFGTNTSAIADPEKEGYTFAGWYDNEACSGSPYVFGTMPAHGVMLYAKWDVNSYTITFVKNNGEQNEIVSYDFGAETAEITRPEKVGFTFGGWYDNAECTGTPYVFGTMPAKNVTLYAKWNINSYTITFVDGSDTLSSTDYQYGEMPVAPEMPSQKIIDERTIAVFKGWSPAVVAATATQTYTAVWENQTRLYGITFEENEFVEFLSTDGDAITSATREFEQSFAFKIRNFAGVNLQNVSVFSNGAKLTPDENGVYTSPFAETTLITVEGIFVEYKLNFTASNATYTTDMPEKLTYGSVVTVYAVGDKWYTDNAPSVTYAGQKIESTGKQTIADVEYHVFPITVDKNGTISIKGIEDIVPVTFVDLNGTETNADWSISYGPIGTNGKLYYTNTWTEYLLEGTNKLYKATSVYDASLNTFVAMTSDTSKQFVEKDEAEAIAQSLADTHLYPTKGDENIYYVVYYYVGEYEESGSSSGYTSTVGFMSPIGSSNFRYFVEGSSSSWITTLYDDANSTGSVNFYELRNNSAQKVMFTEGTVVYIAMDIGSGVLPPFTNISTNEILEAANHTVNGEQVLCYKIVVSQDGNWYTCQNEVNHTITTPEDETGDLFNIYDPRGNTLLQNAQIRDGDSYTFKISSNIKISNILDLFEKQSDGSYLVKEGKTPFEIVGADYTYYTNKLGTYDSFLYVYITLNDVRDDVTVSVNLETRKADFAFKIEEGYSIYIDDTLVTGEVGETVFANVTCNSVLKLVPDDGFIFIDINSDSRIVYYYMKDGVSTRYQSHALDVAKDNTHAIYEFSPYSFYTPIDTSKPVEFLDVMLATHKADNVTQYCASADDLNNITFPDGKPVGVNTDNSLTFSVKLPFGNYPVLFVEYANRLSDGYYTYQAVSSSQEGDYSLFTFEVANIDSDVNWFLELRPNVYEVTVHYGDKTDTVTLTHGQILADCDALLTSFEGSFEGQNGLFKVVGWSSEEGGNANVILVAGPDDLWAVTEFVPYTVSFEGQGFTSLSEALKALDQNASGTLDLLWGSAQELKAGEYSIPSGVTLRLPYAQNSYGRKLAETTDAPSIFYADDAKGTVMLKVAEGATLTVYGTIEVGGIVGYKQSARPYQGQTSSDYSILQLDGKLNVVSGGVLDVNGYIVGNGTVTLLDGAKSKLPFIVKDYRGGTNSSNVYYENIAPFNVYEMPNIQTNYVIHYGASEMAYAMLVAWESYQEIMVEAIGTSGIIRLNQGGYVGKKTTQIDNPRYSEATKAYEPQKEFRTTLDVYGGGRDGAMALNLGITSITTEGVLLAIPYTYSSVTLHDGDYTLYNMYKIMPGATLKVAEDANLVLAAETLDGKAYQGTIITYDESFAENYSGSGPLTSSKQLLYPVQPNGVAEGGKLVVNGTLEIRGRLGADVACEVKGAKIVVYAPNSNLKVTSREAVHFDKGVFTVTYEQTSSATVNGSTNLQYGKVYASGEGGVWA